MTAASMPALRSTEPDSGPAPYAVEELWYMLLSRRWSSLVVVSPDRTPNTLRLARSLAEFGTRSRRTVELVDALQLDVERAAAIARIVIALDSPMANPIAIEVLTMCDAVIVLLEKGVSKIPQARKIIDIVGRQRLIGAVLALE